MTACGRNDALELLRAVNMLQAHGRVGASVFPFDVAESVGLEPCTERYEEAVWHLLWEGALTANKLTPLDVVAVLPFGMAAYRLAPNAVRMLEQA